MDNLATLGKRERELYDLLINSTASTKGIATTMGVTPGTVKVYGNKVYRKLQAPGGRIELLHREIARLRAEAGRG